MRLRSCTLLVCFHNRWVEIARDESWSWKNTQEDLTALLYLAFNYALQPDRSIGYNHLGKKLRVEEPQIGRPWTQWVKISLLGKGAFVELKNDTGLLMILGCS